MGQFLYGVMDIIAGIHSRILSLNDMIEYSFTDKELHFLVIGLLGMGMFFAVHPLFQWLAKKKLVMAISWVYVFTLIIVITFAIEIGQRVSHTGNMEFEDIMFGVVGFLSFFALFLVIRGAAAALLRLARRKEPGRGGEGGASPAGKKDL